VEVEDHLREGPDVDWQLVFREDAQRVQLYVVLFLTASVGVRLRLEDLDHRVVAD